MLFTRDNNHPTSAILAYRSSITKPPCNCKLEAKRAALQHIRPGFIDTELTGPEPINPSRPSCAWESRHAPPVTPSQNNTNLPKPRERERAGGGGESYMVRHRPMRYCTVHKRAESPTFLHIPVIFRLVRRLPNCKGTCPFFFFSNPATSTSRRVPAGQYTDGRGLMILRKSLDRTSNLWASKKATHTRTHAYIIYRMYIYMC